MKLSKQLACLLMSTWLSATAPSWAQSPMFQQGVSSFNSGQYAQALGFFQQELLANPQDPLSHYYSGVCFHSLGRVPEASREYSWILASTQDPELIKRAQMGLQVLAQTRPAPSPIAVVSQQAQSPASVLPAGLEQQTVSANPATFPPGMLQQAAQPAPSGQPPASTIAQPQGEVIDMYTTWCGWCKRFEPLFNEAAGKYASSLFFKRYDAENSPAGRMLAKKYKVNGFPTVLFFDRSGKLVKRIDGAPQSMEDFEVVLFKAYPALKPF